MSQGQPYFSVVVTARNDDHGGNLMGRMQAFVNGWMAQATRHNLSSELIIVEWNPPGERPCLGTAIQWPAECGPCKVRIIQVPAELHRRYAHGEALPLYQMIAKNVGIRRAEGRFVLATNIDIIFSDELVSFLAAGKLEPWRMYRIDRHDAMAEVPVDGIDAQLEYCRTHLIRVNVREGTLPVTPDGRRTLSPDDIASADSGMTFGCGWFPVERASATEFYRWADSDAEIHLPPPAAGTQSLELELEVEPGPGAREMPLRMQFADQTGKPFAHLAISGRCVLKIVLPAGAELLKCSVENGGRGISGDPRTLNFRAFRCEWSTPRIIAPVEKLPAPDVEQPAVEAVPIEVAPVAIETPSVTIAKRRGRPFIYWHRFQQLIALLAERDTVHVPLRAGPRLKQALQAYVQAGGITGMLLGKPRNEKQPEPLPPITPEPMPAPEPLPPATPEPMPAPEPLPLPPAESVSPAFLHTNACGDFTLMARENWHDLRGYPEFDLFSMNLDSVFCFAAHHAGVIEEMLCEPMRIYHIEHGTGSGWTPEGQAQLFARIAQKGLSFLDYREVMDWAMEMRRLQAPMIFNLGNWGLAEYDLPETVIERTSYVSSR